ncbi:MAG: hypothetical protein GKR92_05440 [Gammaproteobacteria bacterium]|nr:MAG: hypothetical protein GKR92_05440 [Gammaproteobacteria bacterium]
MLKKWPVAKSSAMSIIDRESFRNVSNDSPVIGDMTFEFNSSDTKQNYQIIFKLSHMSSKGFCVDLYERQRLDEWKKIATHFMSID